MCVSSHACAACAAVATITTTATYETYANLITYLDGARSVQVYKKLHPGSKFRD